MKFTISSGSPAGEIISFSELNPSVMLGLWTTPLKSKHILAMPSIRARMTGGDHHSDQLAGNLFEKFVWTKIRDELYINMKAVLNFWLFGQILKGR